MNIKKSMSIALAVAVAVAVSILVSPVFAQNKVVVIPMVEDSPGGLANVVTVSAENGDFDSVEDALDSIRDNGPDNRYLIAIGPGHYFVRRPLALKPFVEIRGSGRNVTKLLPKITGDNSAAVVASGSVPLVNQANFTEDSELVISDLTIEHILSSDNTATTVIDSFLFGTIAIRDSNLLVNGTSASQGVSLIGISTSSSLKLTNTRINAVCSQCSRIVGLQGFGTGNPSISVNDSSSITVEGGEATSWGVLYAGAVFEMNESEVQVSGRSAVGIEAGLGDADGMGADIRRSSVLNVNFSSDSNQQADAIIIDGITESGVFSISQSTMRGSVAVSGLGTVACIASDNSFGRALDESCSPVVPEPVIVPE